MKKVSIIIPTRNRAHLLRSALKSALEQDYENLEIVISDNNSTDDTREVVESFNSPKIIYFKTDRDLTMPDNWEFALEKASGEYVTFLTDDSYLFPNCITEALKELERFNLKVGVWKHCTYYSPDWLDSNRRRLLYIPRTTSKSYPVDSREYLEKLFDNLSQVPTVIPRALNSLCHRSVIDKIKSVQGRFFLPSCPDYTSAAAVLLNTDKYLIIDRPYLIDCVNPSSAGAVTAFNLGEGAQEYIGDFDKGVEDVSFLGIPVISADIAKSLEPLRSFYSDRCPEININNLLLKIIDQLSKIEANQGEVSIYWKKLEDYLIKQSKDMKTFNRKKSLSRIKWRTINKIRKSPFRSLETLRIKFRNLHVLKGFNDIEEAAKAAVSLLKS